MVWYTENVTTQESYVEKSRELINEIEGRLSSLKINILVLMYLCSI